MSKTVVGLVFVACIPLTLLLFINHGFSHDQIMFAYGPAVALGVAGWIIGLVTSWILSEDANVDGSLCRLLAWSNLVLWIVPIAGISASAITCEFHKRSHTNTRTYWALSFLGAALATTWVAIYGEHVLNRRLSLASAAPVMTEESMAAHITPANTPRSTARCPFAAMEAWSHADVIKYCWVRK